MLSWSKYYFRDQSDCYWAFYQVQGEDWEGAANRGTDPTNYQFCACQAKKSAVPTSKTGTLGTGTTKACWQESLWPSNTTHVASPTRTSAHQAHREPRAIFSSHRLTLELALLSMAAEHDPSPLCSTAHPAAATRLPLCSTWTCSAPS